MNSSTTGNHYPIASLYVGDLAPEVTEAILFEKFSTAGPVLSIRVCRDIITRRSLGYAYVNYQNSADAERAIDTLNFERLGGRPIRIMWSQRDPSLRRSGLGNIFIKNLDRTVDNKIMFDTFSVFGNILSCKVSYDDKSQSKGYGFVHYDTEEAATSAIENLNGKIVNGKKIFVGKFLSRKERETKMGGGHRRFTNVYVKNLTEQYDTDEKLKALFAPHGEITSAVVTKDHEGKSKGFGFVCFASSEGAEAAVSSLNGKDMGSGKLLYVGRAQKKAEREAELRRKLDAIKAERINRNQGVNLYVKNLEDGIDDQRLQTEFSSFGTITSAKVMSDEKGQSKGFGFVCFSTPEEATKAVTEMNNRIIVSKPLYVALAQRKEDREAQKLNMRYTSGGNLRLPHAMPNQPGLPQANMATPPQFQGQNMAMPMHGQMMAAGGMQQPPYLMPVANPMAHRGFYQNAGPGAGQVQPNAQGIRVNPRWNQMNQGQRQNVGQFNQGGYRGQNPRSAGQPNIRPAMPTGPGGIPGANAQGGRFVQQQVIPGGPQSRVQAPRGPPQGPGLRAGPQGGKPVGGVPPTAPGNFPQINAETAAVSHDEQIQILGENLYPLVNSINAEFAGKITGMLLEMDVAEIQHMINDPSLLKSKVDEAMAVLQAHRAKELVSKPE